VIDKVADNGKVMSVDRLELWAAIVGFTHDMAQAIEREHDWRSSGGRRCELVPEGLEYGPCYIWISNAEVDEF